MKAALHRLEQGARALLAFASPLDLDLARRHLSECEYAAFARLGRSEQLHSLQVLRAVQRARPDAPPCLLAAALLHDIGKTRYRMALWQKTVAVLLEALLPGLARRLAESDSRGPLRMPFRARRRHPAWSGEILRGCESAEAVIWLAEHHQDDAETRRGHVWHGLLKTLQAADADN